MPTFITPKLILLAGFLLFCLSVKAQSNPGKIVFADDDSGRLLLKNTEGTGQTKLAFATNRSGFRTLEIRTVKTDGRRLVRLTSNVQLSTGEVDLGTPSTTTVTIADNHVRLITELDSDRAIAVNTMSLVAEPFSLTTLFNFSNDKRTRISLFVENLQFNQGFPSIIVEATDSQLNNVQLPLEAIASFSAFPFTQLIVRLPENLSPGVVFVAVRVNGQLSNTARISITP